MKTKIYEFECQRSNVTPKQFYDYCKNQAQNKKANIEDWANYEDWINEKNNTPYHKDDHKDWDEPQTEIIKMMSYDWQIYLQNAYNFIMEFEFDDEKRGHGYLFMVEFKR